VEGEIPDGRHPYDPAREKAGRDGSGTWLRAFQQEAGETMQLVADTITIAQLRELATATFGNLVKAVVDVDRGLIALDAELHADLEAFLLEEGSAQNSLWGVNLYPEPDGDDFVEFDALINIRPSQGNRSRTVESAEIRDRIAAIVAQKIGR
jgi:hypothetical protein